MSVVCVCVGGGLPRASGVCVFGLKLSPGPAVALFCSRRPRALGLPSHDEITAIEHAAMFRLNGFELAIDEDAPVGHRVKLVAQPVSKDTVFGVADLEELLDLIHAAPSGEVVRPSKARRMFASRACRKSVMIGKALNANQMRAVVRHMGTMDQPWVRCWRAFSLRG